MFAVEEAGLWPGFALPFTEWLAEEKFLREYELLLYPAVERYQHFRDHSPEVASLDHETIEGDLVYTSAVNPGVTDLIWLPEDE